MGNNESTSINSGNDDNHEITSTIGRNLSETTTTTTTTIKKHEALRAKSFLNREEHEQHPSSFLQDERDFQRRRRRRSQRYSRSSSIASTTTSGTYDYNDDDNDDDDDDDDDDEARMMKIQQLEWQVQQLSNYCSILESQNILVPVQQLDLLTRIVSYSLTFSALIGYWKLIFWITTTTTTTSINTNDIISFLQEHFQQHQQYYDGWIPSSIFLFWEEGKYQDYYETFIQDNIVSKFPDWIMNNKEIMHDWISFFLGMIGRTILLTILPYWYHQYYTHGSLHRRFQVFVIAAIFILRIRLCRWRDRMFAADATSNKTNNNNNAILYGEQCTSDAIWNANYEITARYLYLGIVRLRGLWTKTAQYLSSRADFMPIAYIRELSKLQDQAPATDWEDVRRVLPKGLIQRLQQAAETITEVEEIDSTSTTGKMKNYNDDASNNKKHNKNKRKNKKNNKDWILQSVMDPIPLASASIGQVHQATIVVPTESDNNNTTSSTTTSSSTTNTAAAATTTTKSSQQQQQYTLQKVAIKVQHPHARSLMTDDFRSLKILTKLLTWLEPDYGFMEILIKEWSMEARKELDFRFEAFHLQEAQKALREMYRNSSKNNKYDKGNEDNNNNANDNILYTSPSTNSTPYQVEIPKPILELSNENVLVMSFCEGCRVDNLKQLQEWNLSKDAIMDAIAQTFAHFMYCSTIFNGDPHAGNILVRPGIQRTSTRGSNIEDATTNTKNGNNDKDDTTGSFTLILLDWGLAKQLPNDKRIAFCQMVYAAATGDYGLLLDSYTNIGLQMKREDAGQSMEDMRFFLRDMAPRQHAKERITKRIKKDQERMKKTNEKVPMESKAYPGEFFFFIRVNELLHGLGSRFDINLGYLNTLKPYAEQGLRQAITNEYNQNNENNDSDSSTILAHSAENKTLQEKLQIVLNELGDEGSIVGAQVCVLDKDGTIQANVISGTLGGLRSHITMQENALILGYSTTKAVTATLAHIMVEEGYLTYDEPICERVWKAFCPTKYPTAILCKVMRRPMEETIQQWQWKRQITLRHILNHTAGFGMSLPRKLTIQKFASCEECFASYEYNDDVPEDTLLPIHAPGETTEYHFLSFGWLVAGTLCGAYSLKRHKRNVTFVDVYNSVLEHRLSPETRAAGFQPMGLLPSSSLEQSPFPVAQTVTADIRASELMQQMRDTTIVRTQQPNENDETEQNTTSIASAAVQKALFKTFRGKEFLLDPRIWNNSIAQKANVPAAGGRFSATGLARFYWDLSNGKLVSASILHTLILDSFSNEDEKLATRKTHTYDGTKDEGITNTNPTITTTTTTTARPSSSPSISSLLQGVTRIANDNDANTDLASRSKLHLGYQLLPTERDDAKNTYSCIGHAGIGGSIGFWHRPTGLCVGLMLNKADADQEVTIRILRVIADEYGI